MFSQIRETLFLEQLSFQNSSAHFIRDHTILSIIIITTWFKITIKDVYISVLWRYFMWHYSKICVYLFLLMSIYSCLGAGVVTTRAHVHYVVTEHGIAYLFGKSLRQRAHALINIAHPNHRESLEKAAFERLKCMPSP